MEHSNATISKSLLDVAAFADEILHSTPSGRRALAGTKLNPGQRRLLERIDGFRSIDQILAMSGDVIGVHATLGKMIELGLVTSDAAGATAPASVVRESVAAAVANPAPRPEPTPVRTPSLAPAPAKVAVKEVAKNVVTKTLPREAAKAAAKSVALEGPSEMETAKKLLILEARHLLGEGAARLQPRIEACGSIAEIYDIIVKFQQHLSKTGKANPDVFLDRLTRGLQLARKQAAKSGAKAAARTPAENLRP